MATVQIPETGSRVIFGWPKEGGGSERITATVMHGTIRGHARLALQSLQLPSLRARLVREVSFDVPRFYSAGGLRLPNTGEHRRYLRIAVAGRTPIWLRFDRFVQKDLVAALQAIVARPAGKPAGESTEKPRRGRPPGSTTKGRKLMSKVVKQPGGILPEPGPKSARGEAGKKIPGSKPIKKTEMSRGWDSKKG